MLWIFMKPLSNSSCCLRGGRERGGGGGGGECSTQKTADNVENRVGDPDPEPDPQDQHVFQASQI